MCADIEGGSLRRNPATPLLLLAWFCCLLLSAPPLVAQEEPATDLFVDVVDVNLVNLEVYVTDDDEPVTGLTIDDFEVFEDGEPVEVTNFYVVEAGKPVLDPVAAAEETPVEEAATSASSPAPEQQLSLILYVDDFNLLPKHRNKAFKELREFLSERLATGDRAMLVSFDRTIEVHTPLTGDGEVLFDALEGLELGISRRATLQREYDILLRQIIGDTLSGDPCLLGSGVRALAQQIYSETQASMDAMSQFVTSLEGIPGRKAVLHLSSGLQQRPAEELYYAWWNRFSGSSDDCSMSRPEVEASVLDLHRFYRELTANANAHRVTFYTLNAGGYERFDNISAERTGGNVFRSQPVWSSFEEAIRRENGNAGLRTLAIETGGQPLLNLNRFNRAIERVASDFDSYYSLGYLAGEGGAGEGADPDRKIEVRLREGSRGNRRGVEVRHRTGYRKKSRSELAGAHTLSALFLGQESNPMGIRVEVDAGTRQSRDTYRVPVLVRIPISQLALIPHEGTHQARLKVFLVLGEQVGGRLSSMHEMDVPVSIPPDKVRLAATQDFGFTVQLDVRGGEQRLAVGVLDTIAAIASYVTTSFDASAAATVPADATDSGAGAP